MPIDEYYLKRSSNIFAIKKNDLINKGKLVANDIIPQELIGTIQVFAKIPTVEYEGYYIAKVDNKIEVLKVISVSSQNLITEHGTQIVNIATTQVKILAKFINNGVVITDQQKLLIADQ
jgi:prolyl oligopeptidase PreP (S9A serine peptidase family)